MSKDCLDVVTPFPGPTRCRPSQPPKRKSLYPNLSQYAANRAQTVQIEPNGAFSCQLLRGEPERNHPFANRCTRENYSEVSSNAPQDVGMHSKETKKTGKKGRVEADGRDSVGF